MIKRIICYFKAVPFLIKSGIWCPHVYGENKYEPAIIIATSKSFRTSKSCLHGANETVYSQATLITNECLHCGHKMQTWYDGNIEDIPKCNAVDEICD